MNTVKAAAAFKAHQLAAAIPMIDQPSPVAPPGVADKTQMVLNWLMWGGGIAFVLGLILAFIMVMLANSDRAPGFTQHLSKVGFVIAGGIGLTAVGAIGSAIMG